MKLCWMIWGLFCATSSFADSPETPAPETPAQESPAPGTVNAAEMPAPPAPQDDKRDWTFEDVDALPKSLQKQIKKGIKLFEKGKMIPFLEMFIHPKDREKMPPIEQVAAHLQSEKGEVLMNAFRAASTAKKQRASHPTMKERWVVLVREQVPDAPDDLVFEEVDGLWRLFD